jgi:ankyrin repeat protein
MRLAATGFLIRTSEPREHPFLPTSLVGLRPVEIKSMVQRVGYTVNSAGSSSVSDLESHFSKLLIETCIVNDVKGATELLHSILSCAKVEAVSSFHESHQEEPWTTTIEGFRPLHWASLFGNAEIVSLLLEGGANTTSTTATGMTPVDIAAMLGHVQVLKLLVEGNRDRIDYLPPQPPLLEHPCHLAAAHVRSDDVEAVLRLLMPVPSESDYTKTSPFNGMTNNVGETPLHRAAAMANIRAATAILDLDENIDVNQQDNAGRAALWHASAAGAASVVSFLLNAGADHEQPDRYGLLALHAACRGGHRFTVDLLLEHDDNHVHAKMSKFTPAHFATLSGDVDTLRVLKKHGQDLNAYVERERAWPGDRAGTHRHGQLQRTVPELPEVRWLRRDEGKVVPYFAQRDREVTGAGRAQEDPASQGVGQELASEQ